MWYIYVERGGQAKKPEARGQASKLQFSSQSSITSLHFPITSLHFNETGQTKTSETSDSEKPNAFQLYRDATMTVSLSLILTAQVARCRVWALSRLSIQYVSPTKHVVSL